MSPDARDRAARNSAARDSAARDSAARDSAADRDSSSTLDDRYGRRARPGRRRLVVVVAMLAALVVAVPLVWAAVRYASPPVTSRLLAFRVVDDAAVTVTLEVTVDAGTPASCEVVARAGDQQVVGRRTVAVPAGPERIDVLVADVATERGAVSAELLGCTAPGMSRPR